MSNDFVMYDQTMQLRPWGFRLCPDIKKSSPGDEVGKNMIFVERQPLNVWLLPGQAAR